MRFGTSRMKAPVKGSSSRRRSSAVIARLAANPSGRPWPSWIAVPMIGEAPRCMVHHAESVPVM